MASGEGFFILQICITVKIANLQLSHTHAHARAHTHALTHTLTHSLTLTLTHTLSHTHTLTHMGSRSPMNMRHDDVTGLYGIYYV